MGQCRGQCCLASSREAANHEDQRSHPGRRIFVGKFKMPRGLRRERVSFRPLSLLGAKRGHLGPDARAIRLVKIDENLRRLIANSILIHVEKPWTDPGRAEKVTLSREER